MEEEEEEAVVVVVLVVDFEDANKSFVRRLFMLRRPSAEVLCSDIIFGGGSVRCESVSPVAVPVAVSVSARPPTQHQRVQRGGCFPNAPTQVDRFRYSRQGCDSLGSVTCRSVAVLFRWVHHGTR